MITATVLEGGNLRLTASPEDLAELHDYDHWGEVDVLTHGMEHYWTSGRFQPFDPGHGNPFIGLTEAPCIAESMEVLSNGQRMIVGRLWWYPQYELKDCIHELVKHGYVDFTFVN